MENEVKIKQDFGRIQNWIGGRYQASSANQYGNIYSPYTGGVIGEYPVGTQGDVDHAVAVAKKHFQAGEIPISKPGCRSCFVSNN